MALSRLGMVRLGRSKVTMTWADTYNSYLLWVTPDLASRNRI